MENPERFQVISEIDAKLTSFQFYDFEKLCREKNNDPSIMKKALLLCFYDFILDGFISHSLFKNL